MTQPVPIEFEGRLPYRRLPNQGPCPLAQVTLRLNGNEVTAFAVLDSGASVTVFQRELAAQLGIDDITTGVRDDVSTGGGLVPSYLFDVEMELQLDGDATKRMTCQVGFWDGHLPRNILGRNLVFAQFTLAFLERQELVLYKSDEQ